ncbi:MAG: GTPase HflX [Armatimonadota bacterium]|nr:GTPase HflX [Armatimonadota bacterium]MDR7467146.1 GTPase HflX [Armatimonadota bacterium]MDR7493312.1 GTPase HflX [Armatimonadota bacterium]MDR7505440.1 GTPase HflX [Armatimonadota bacterium]MDR7546732.1 GTPase HflX [Armatimonadota bacterium]
MAEIPVREAGPERAVLIGVHGENSARDPEMEELARLADSAGAEVVGTLVQHRRRPAPATFLGAGKVDELRVLCLRTDADLVIADHELTPVQQRNLERLLNRKVIDRTALVLDIFARRARTHEGRLQVELAQMIYLLPRLTGRGTMLSRLGGGIGTRGPGETKLEVDRRRIRRRITDLRREIAEIRRHRALQRRWRREAQIPTVALVGYTNAGKSTLLNALTDAGVFVEDKLFATLDPTVRRVTLPNGRAVLLVDTVGFITRLPTQLVAAFRATLEEVTEADLLVHVVDGSHPDWREQMRAVGRVLAELGAADKPTVVAVNKTDRIPPADVRAILAEIGTGVAISALHQVGLLNLLREIALRLPEDLVTVRLTVPYNRAGTLSQIFEQGRVLRQEYAADGIRLEARLPRGQAERLRALVRRR